MFMMNRRMKVVVTMTMMMTTTTTKKVKERRHDNKIARRVWRAARRDGGKVSHTSVNYSYGKV